MGGWVDGWVDDVRVHLLKGIWSRVHSPNGISHRPLSPNGTCYRGAPPHPPSTTQTAVGGLRYRGGLCNVLQAQTHLLLSSARPSILWNTGACVTSGGTRTIATRSERLPLLCIPTLTFFSTYPRGLIIPARPLSEGVPSRPRGRCTNGGDIVGAPQLLWMGTQPTNRRLVPQSLPMISCVRRTAVLP